MNNFSLSTLKASPFIFLPLETLGVLLVLLLRPSLVLLEYVIVMTCYLMTVSCTRDLGTRHVLPTLTKVIIHLIFIYVINETFVYETVKTRTTLPSKICS